MRERLVFIGLGLMCLALSFGSAFGTRETWREHERIRDHARWVESPGRLAKLELVGTVHRSSWQFRVDCEYDVLTAGASHRADVFDIARPKFPDAAQAKAFVESTLGLEGRGKWRAIRHGSAEGWALDAPGLALRVRHSPRDPSAASLTSTPPVAPGMAWVVIAVLGTLCVVTGLGGLVLVAAPFLPDRRVRTGAERARGEASLPLVGAAVRGDYAGRLEAAIAAGDALRAAEGSTPDIDKVLAELRVELDAARQGPMRKRHSGLYLCRRLDLAGTTPAESRLNSALGAVDAYLEENLVAQDDPRGR